MATQRTKGNGVYAPLGAGYFRDDAVLEAGEAAELLFVRGLSYCAETPSDGFISDRQLTMVVGIGMRDALKRAERLCQVDLWQRVEGGYVVRSWLKWNKSAEEIGRFRKRDRERKASQATAGIQTDSARNPDGTQTDSTLQYTTHQSTTHQSTSATRPAPLALAVADEIETINQRANRLAKAYTDRVPMSRFPAVAGIVKAAVKASKSDREITDALTRLAAEGRSLTVETLRIELEGQPAPRPRPSTVDTTVIGAYAIAAELEAEPDRREIS